MMKLFGPMQSLLLPVYLLLPLPVPIWKANTA